METPSEQRFFPQFGRLAGLLLSVGAITGGSLVLLDVPVWAFYLAPVVGLPILFRALRTIDEASTNASELDWKLSAAGWARNDSMARTHRETRTTLTPRYASAERSASLLPRIALLLALLALGAGIAFAVGFIGNDGEPKGPPVSKKTSPTEVPQVPPRVEQEPSGTPDNRAPSYASSDDGSQGSSSPLVPILIAIAALAAISIGAVVVRQRRARAQHNAEPHGRLL